MPNVVHQHFASTRVWYMRLHGTRVRQGEKSAPCRKSTAIHATSARQNDSVGHCSFDLLERLSARADRLATKTSHLISFARKSKST